MRLQQLLATTAISSALIACTSPTPPVAVQHPASSAQADADAPSSVVPAETPSIRIPAAELRQRILTLMDSLHSAQDTNAPQVAKSLQMELPQHKSGAGVNRELGITDEGWSFLVSVLKYGDTPGSRASIYIHPDDAGAGKISKTCSFEWNAFVDDIEKMGYMFEARSPRMGVSDEWSYGRGAQAIYLQQYAAKDDTKTEQACVYSIIME